MDKVETIDQYIILEHIKKHFNIEWLEFEKLEKNAIKITDINKDSIIFKYENNKIIWE